MIVKCSECGAWRDPGKEVLTGRKHVHLTTEKVSDTDEEEELWR